ncbi:TPA: OsmC family protein [Listeria monocytogenes]
MAKEIFTAETTLLSGLKVSCKSRNFEMLIDEPRTSGGTDTGMNPVEVLLNSLGACLTIVAKSFAKSKKINLNSFKVELEGELDTDGFMYKNPEIKKGFSKINIIFHVDADNSTEEINSFIKFVEETCPVHDTIVNTPIFEQKIVTY